MPSAYTLQQLSSHLNSAVWKSCLSCEIQMASVSGILLWFFLRWGLGSYPAFHNILYCGVQNMYSFKIYAGEFGSNDSVFETCVSN